VRKQQLKIAVSLMFAVMGLFFLYVLIAGMGAQNSHDTAVERGEFTHVLPGQTVLRRVNGHRVWVSRLSAHQQTVLNLNNPYLVDQISSCGDLEVCVLLASAARHGLDIVFSKKEPPQLPSKVVWNGGFVDPTSGAVFDLMGRPYRLDKPSDTQRMKAL